MLAEETAVKESERESGEIEESAEKERTRNSVDETYKERAAVSYMRGV